jgi:hypothetical protein
MSNVIPEATDEASATRIDPAESLPPLGTVGLLRWLWRQLTSMRTALILLQNDPALAGRAGYADWLAIGAALMHGDTGMTALGAVRQRLAGA